MAQGNSGIREGQAFALSRSKALLLALLGACVWFAVCIALFGMRYEVNDDAIISNIAAGAYGGETQYLVYPNILLGFLLKGLYWFAAAVNWFVVVLIPPALACFAYVGSLLLRRLGWLWGFVSYASFLVLAGTEFFTRFHYVRYAAVFLAAGLLLLALHLGRWDIGTFTGGILVFWGSLLRFQQLAATGGIALAFLLYRFILLDKPAKRRALACAAACVVAVFAAFGADKLAYAQSADWRAYTAYNAARTEVSDYKLYLLEGVEGGEAVGLTAEEYDLLQSWTFYDTEYFDTEYLSALGQSLPGNTAGNALKTAASAAAKALFARPVNLLLAAVLMLWLFFGFKRRWPVLLGTLAGYGVMLFYLAWRLRVLERVEYGISYAAILFCGCVLFGSQGAIRAPMVSRVPAVLAALLVVAAMPSLLAQYDTTQDYWQSRTLREADTHELITSNDGQALYLLDADLVDAANGFTVWRAKPQGYFARTVFVGSWLMNSPYERATLQAWGMENPYRDAIDRQDVYFADYYHRALKEGFIRQQYDRGVELVLEEEWGSFNLYRACTHSEDNDT